jgi:hypothetical protein
MAHYAFLDQDNIVTDVIVGKDEGEGDADWELRYSLIRGQACKRTSYNTYGGQHKTGGLPFRMNFAGAGFTYDADRDAFIPPRLHASWVLDESTCHWVAPVPYPDDGQNYFWDEALLSWAVVPNNS